MKFWGLQNQLPVEEPLVCAVPICFCSITTCQRFIHILKASSNDSLQTFTTGISFHACGWSMGSPASMWQIWKPSGFICSENNSILCLKTSSHGCILLLNIFLQLLDFTWTCHAVITKSVLILSHQFRLQPPAPVGSVPRQCSFVFLTFRLTFIYLTYVYFISFFYNYPIS